MKCMLMSAIWCPPCQTLKPIFKKVSESTEGVEFVVVDIDEEPELTAKMNIMSVPTIVFEKDGKVMDSMVGLVSEQNLRNKIEELK